MGIEEIITCDKCNKRCYRQLHKNFHWNAQPVRITLSHDFVLNNTPHVTPSSTSTTVLWCRECAMRYGLAKVYTNEDREVAPDVEELSVSEQLANALESLGFVREF